MIVRCTKKMRAELRLKETAVPREDASPSRLDEWFCDLLRIDRGKYVLCTNARTLFSIVLPKVRRADLVDFHHLLRVSVAGALEAEGYSSDAIECVAPLREVRYARTNSRRVLGSMNDLAFQYRVDLERFGERAILNGLIGSRLNRNPMSAIGRRCAIDALRAEISPNLN